MTKLDAGYRVVWVRSCVNACSRFATLLELGRKLKKIAYSKYGYCPDATAWGQQPWTLESASLPLTCPAKHNNTHLRKLSFLVALIVVDFIKKNIVIFINGID
jgi:hypothetical protein